jgi:uncharacterized membrane protein
MNIIEGKLEKRTARLFPYFLILIAGLGISLTIILKRSDLTVFSLIFVVPLLFAAVILLINKNISIGELIPYTARIQFSHLFLIGMLVFIISLIMLVSYSDRQVTYFIFIALYSGIVLLQILCRRPNWTDNLIVLEIVLLSLNLIWGVSLKYPLYFADTDSLIHMHFIDTILKTSHVQTYDISYQYYPVYHILNAIGSEISGLSIRTALFILMGIAWQTTILFSYLIFKKLSHSSRFAAIACLLFASSSQFIFYGSYAIARSLAFVFLIAWLYLITSRGQQKVAYLLLSLVVMVAMIMTHHINVLLVIPMLLLAYFCQILANRFRQDRPFEPLFIFLFSICCIGYLIWFAPNLSSSTLLGTIKAALETDTSIKGDVTSGYGLGVIIGAIYYSWVLILCLLGMRIVFHHLKTSLARSAAGAFATAGFFLLIIYIPGPLDLLPISDILMATRLNLMVSPFIAFLMAYGITYLLSNIRNIQSNFIRVFSWPALSAGLVILTTFFSSISTGNAQDNDNFLHTATIDTPYFDNSELASFSFLNYQTDTEQPLYSDYQVCRNDYLLDNFAARFIITGGDLSYIQDGYLALRTGELYRKTALTFSPDGYAVNSFRYSLASFKSEMDTPTNLGSKDRVYTNGSVQVYILHKPNHG